jgi:hypothetical protein
MQFPASRLQAIHKALHSKRDDGTDFEAIMIGGIKYCVRQVGNQRRLCIERQCFITQNPNSDSDYGERARNGEYLTWWLKRDWVLMTGDVNQDLMIERC